MHKKIHLLKVSGTIGSAKQKEFEQTIRFVFNMLPAGCFSRHLAHDVFQPNLFHAFFLWNSSEELEAFTHSDEFSLLKGSFQALGSIDKSLSSHEADVHAFHVDEEEP